MAEIITEKVNQVIRGFPTWDWERQLTFIRFNAQYFEYSINESLQAFVQNPEATRLKTLQEWQELSEETKVREGERALYTYNRSKGTRQTLFDVSQLTGVEASLSPHLTSEQFLAFLKAKEDGTSSFFSQAEEAVRAFLVPFMSQPSVFTQKENASAVILAMYQTFERYGLTYDKSLLETTLQRVLQQVEKPERLLRVLNLGNSFSRGVDYQLRQGLSSEQQQANVSTSLEKERTAPAFISLPVLSASLKATLSENKQAIHFFSMDDVFIGSATIHLRLGSVHSLEEFLENLPQHLSELDDFKSFSGGSAHTLASSTTTYSSWDALDLAFQGSNPRYRNYVASQRKGEQNEKLEPSMSETSSELSLEAQHEAAILETLQKGSLVSGGKFRIQRFFNENPKLSARAQFLAKEYGQGGYASPDLPYYENHDRKGILLDGRDESWQAVHLTWSQAATRIDLLIGQGNYLTSDEQKEYEVWKGQQVPEAPKESAEDGLSLFDWSGDEDEVKNEEEIPNDDEASIQTWKETVQEVAVENVKEQLETLEAELSDGIFDYLMADSDLFDKTMTGYQEIISNLDLSAQELTVSKGDSNGVFQVILFRLSLANGKFDWSSTAFNSSQKAQLERYVKECLVRSGYLKASSVQNEQSEVPVSEAVIAEPVIQSESAHDYSFNGLSDEELTSFYPSTPTKKVASNLEIIRLIKQLEKEERRATESEQDILAHYVGWGGLANTFFDEHHPKFEASREALKGLVSEEEYVAMRASSLTAYYTEPSVIQEIFRALEQTGFQGGAILDPSMGTGNFFASMPEEMKNHSQLYGVELDSLTGQIAKQLQQSSNIQVQGFERTNFASNSLDCVISNIPFGDFSLTDNQFERPYLIHDYFIKKSLDLVHEGGFVAVITSTGTLDKRDPRFRSEIATEAQLVSAVRLPDTAFSRVAGTEATSDLLIFQKTSTPEPNPEWLETVSLKDGKGNEIFYNRYFANHPEQILGQLEIRAFRGGALSVKADYEAADLAFELRSALENSSAHYYSQNVADTVFEPQQASSLNIPDDVLKQAESYTLFIYEGQPYYKEESQVALFQKTASLTLKTNENRQAQLSRYESIEAQIFDEKEVSGGRQYFYYQSYNVQEIAAMAQMIALRHSLQNLLAIQHQPHYSMETYEKLRVAFNVQYDSFITAFGPIGSQANSLLMRQDDYYEFLASVEEERKDEQTGNKTYVKGTVFFEPTIQTASEVVHVETAEDALLASLNYRGELDFDYMNDIYPKPKEAIIEELGDHLFYVGDGNYETQEDYLSGDVKTRLTTAKNNQEFGLEGFDWNRNISALEAVIPADIALSDINYHLGTRFIPKAIYQEFLTEALGQRNLRAVKVVYDQLDDSYLVEVADRQSDANERAYGIGRRYDGAHLATTLLNQREPQVYNPDPNDPTGKKRILDKQATDEIRTKGDEMKRAFKEWILKNPKTQEQVVSIYNSVYNRTVVKNYDGSRLSVSGLARQFQLRPHQKNAIMRIVQEHRAGLFHEVGSGKSLTMLASAMKLKELGKIQKPMYVVPKPLLEQFGHEIYTYFPDSRVLIAHSEDFSKANRKRFISRIQTGKYDAVVIADSQFEKVAMSKAYQENFLKNQLAEARDTLSRLEERYTIKKTEQLIKNLQKRLESLQKKDTDSFVHFEDLGVDMLYVDEAHNYKNLAPMTQLSGVKGVSDTRSQKAMDLQQKIDYLHGKYDNANVVFATGTPISNSVTELYTMMNYLAPDCLQARGIQSFDSWVSTFGTIESVFELTAAGSYKVKRRFTKFGNMPELRNLFREVADIQTSEDLDLPVPEVETFAHQTQTTSAQADYIDGLIERADAIEAGEVMPWEDNMLKIVGENRKLTLDMRMLDDHKYSAYDSYKIRQVVEQVYQIWKDTAEERSTQMIFSDLGIPMKYRNTNTQNLDGSMNQFSAYDEIKTQLVNRGVPEQEIRFIHEATEANKSAMMQEMRSGKIRILLASTGKGGTGLNVQDKLIAVHHLDVPWRPSDITQRNGRLIRQGNENLKVQVHYYITKGSMDAFLWQMQENKLKFVNQMMSGKSDTREMEEMDNNNMNPTTFKALSEGDPVKFEYMQLEQDLKLLESSRNRYYESKATDEKRIEDQRKKLPLYEKRLVATKEDMAQAELTKFKPFEMTLYYQGQEKVYGMEDKKSEVGNRLIQLIRETVSEEKALIKIASYRGFDILYLSEPQSTLLGRLGTGEERLTIRGKTDYHLSLPLTSGAGTLERINNKMDHLVKDQDATTQEITRLTAAIQRIEENRDKPFAKEADYKEKLVRFEELRLQLDSSSKPLEDDFEAAL